MATARRMFRNPRGTSRFAKPAQPLIRPVIKKKLVKKRVYALPNLAIYSSRLSTGARLLAKQLSCRRWINQPAILPAGAIVVNWGDTSTPNWLPRRHILNPPEAIRRATNKLETLKCLEQAKVPCLRYTTDKEEAAKWVKKGKEVFARTSLSGSGGHGIVIASNIAALVAAPLYTRNYPKTHEFRIHVFDGQAIDFTEKKASVNETGNVAIRDRLVRNHDNGWIFAHDNLSPSKLAKDEMERVAINAVNSLGLLFGAVDILAILEPNGADRRGIKSCAVCEINTAPGLECTRTIAAYVEAIRKKYHSINTKEFR